MTLAETLIDLITKRINTKIKNTLSKQKEATIKSKAKTWNIS
jgi:hypothetical protein